MINHQFLHKIDIAASHATPKASGNLNNARRVRKISDTQFEIVYSGSQAGYGWSLDKGRLLWGALWERRINNPHYQWFSKGVHNNVLNTIATAVGVKTKKQYNLIPPQEGTYMPNVQRQQLNDPQRVNYENMIRVQRKWNSRFLEQTLEGEKGETI